MLFPDGLSGPIGETPLDYLGTPLGMTGVAIDVFRGYRDPTNYTWRNLLLVKSLGVMYFNPSPAAKVGATMGFIANLTTPYKDVPQIKTKPIKTDDPDWLLPRGLLKQWLHNQIKPGWDGYVPPQKVIQDPVAGPSSKGTFDLCPPGYRLVNDQCVKY